MKFIERLWKKHIIGEPGNMGYEQNVQPKAPLDQPLELDTEIVPSIDIPDTIEPSSTVQEYLAGQPASQAQGFVTGVIVEELKHLIASEPENQKKRPEESRR